jgi:hypothetical protein
MFVKFLLFLLAVAEAVLVVMEVEVKRTVEEVGVHYVMENLL